VAPAPVVPDVWTITPTTPVLPLDFDLDLERIGRASSKIDLEMREFDKMAGKIGKTITPKVDFKYDFDYDLDIAPSVDAAIAGIEPMLDRIHERTFEYDEARIASTIEHAAAAASKAAMTIGRTMIAAPAFSVSAFENQFSGIASTPAQGWASGDPADSLYRVARETLNRGEYRRASELFDQIAQKYPSSAYASDARYWKAFALYRIGSTEDLREALRTLEKGNGRYSEALQVDAPTLATRIRGALAARGDARAATVVQREASETGATCDREDIAVRVEALNSLGQMDPESAAPMLKRLLQRKDVCSAGLRRSAIFLLAKRGDPEAFSLLSSAAKTDPDLRVRAEAVRWLARLPGDQAVSVLEELVRTSDNSEIQGAAIEALGSSDSPRARQSLRTLAERSDLNERLRAVAIESMDKEHSDDGGAFLRGLYPRLNTPRLQLVAIRSIARFGGDANEQWLLSLVKSPSVSLDVRRTALSYAGRGAINIGDLVKMYDSMADRPLREQLISLYSRRTEPEATDKLIDIARTGTDPELRRLAISSLSRKNDPRTKKLLLEIIDK